MKQTLGPPTSARVRPELELLIRCSRPSDAGGTDLQAILGKDIDWTYLISSALAHGVSPLLADRLAREAAGVPPEIRAALEEHLLDNRQRNARLMEALLELLDALRERGVRAIPFKGQVLGLLAYGDSSLRRAGDVDILLLRDDIPIALAVLERLGYRELREHAVGRTMSRAEHAFHMRYQCEYALLRAHDRIVVEPHWALAPKTLAIAVDYEGFFARAGTVSLDGRVVPSLSLDDLVLALCIHGSKHEWTRLQWISDVAELLQRHPETDLERTLSVARAYGVQRMVLLGLGLAHHVLQAPLPAAVVRRLMDDKAVGRLARVAFERMLEPIREDTSIYQVSGARLRMRERLRDRARYVVRTLMTPTEKHMRLMSLPRSLHFLYVPIKLGHDYVALPLWKAAKRIELHRAGG